MKPWALKKHFPPTQQPTQLQAKLSLGDNVKIMLKTQHAEFWVLVRVSNLDNTRDSDRNLKLSLMLMSTLTTYLTRTYTTLVHQGKGTEYPR